MNRQLGENIRAVLFDFDGTMVNTIGSKWDQHKFIARKYYDKDLTDEEIALHWGKPLSQLVCLLYETDDAEQALANNARHMNEFPKEIFSETNATLQKLKMANKVIGIITATNRMNIEHDLESTGISLDLIDYIQTADETECHKPNPQVFDPAKKWLNEKGISEEEVLYVGDGIQDMQAAIGAGFDFIGVESGLIKAEQFANHGVDSVPGIANLLD